MVKADAKKVKDAVRQQLNKHEIKMRAEYKKSIANQLKWAEQSLKDYAKSLAEKKERVEKNKAELLSYKTTKKVPDSFAQRYGGHSRNVPKLIKLQNKLAFCKGETINITESELALLS